MTQYSTNTDTTYLVGSAASVFSVSGLRLRLWPILATIGLGLLVILPSGFVYVSFSKQIGMQRVMAMPWLALLANHAVMLGIALALIAWLSKGSFSAYGLQWPKERHYVLSALLWGAAFGALMTLVDYFPQILNHTPPPENSARACEHRSLAVFSRNFCGTD